MSNHFSGKQINNDTGVIPFPLYFKTRDITNPHAIRFRYVELLLEQILTLCSSHLFFVLPFGISANALQIHLMHKLAHISAGRSNSPVSKDRTHFFCSIPLLALVEYSFNLLPQFFTAFVI